MNPTGLRVAAVLVAILAVAAAGGAYYSFSRPVSNGCHLQSTNPLVIDQPETPDSLDPAVTFSTPGWAAVQQVYQELINYNQTSTTSFVGELAKNWSFSKDGLHWNFTLWANEKFSNGDPVNAYVVWYSLYRDLLMNQASSFILSENFWFPGESYYAPDGSYPWWNATVVNNLLNMLNGPPGTFFSPSSSDAATMGAPNQSFQVLSPTEIEFNLGFGYLDYPAFSIPYTYVLPELSAPNSAAVDPAVVDANGKIVLNSSNAWMSENMVGSGPFVLTSYSLSSGFTLTPDPHYWAQSVAPTVPWDNMIQPAKSTIETLFQGTTSIDVQNLRGGSAAAVSFAYVGPSTVTELQGVACVTVQPLPTVFGATAGSWWIYMNQSDYPFNNLSVREAVVHAINYQEIIQDAFGGYAQQWVGPVPPSYPDYNPNNLPNYTYNLALAQQEIANSPCRNNACANMQPLHYSYINLGDWQTVATILQQNLQAIGIPIQPVPISLNQLYVEQGHTSSGACVSSTNIAGGPFPIGQEFYTSDYISPDDWTTNDAVTGGSANGCMAGYTNSTVDGWIYQAAGTSDPALASQLYGNITSAMYYNYTDAWLVVPTSFAVYSSALQGFYENAMGSAVPYIMTSNTMYGT
ncbi:MAG TPA: ABC transporter substrate-binding protein [Thermoplasmata archaeon]|nr:ABC transporter substrate-binding protein [Thermoplasmata archaeon]